MSQRIASAAGSRQASPRDLATDDRDLSAEAGSPTCDLDFIVDLFNAAIEASSWNGKTEALAVAMDIDRGYLSKVRSKEKPLNLKMLRSLPDDVEAIFAQKWAEAFGFIVVAPLHGHDAVRSFVAGALGIFAARLPEKSSGQLRASLPEPAERRARA